MYYDLFAGERETSRLYTFSKHDDDPKGADRLDDLGWFLWRHRSIREIMVSKTVKWRGNAADASLW